MPKPRPIASLDELWTLAQEGPIDVVLLLGGLLRSSHSLQVVKDRLVDDSMVDGSQTRYTRKQLEKCLYAKAIERRALWLE